MWAGHSLGYSGVTVMEDGGGRYLTNTDAYQTTRIVGGGQQYQDVEVRFAYRFGSQTHPSQSVEVMPMYVRDQDGVELSTSLRVSPEGLLLRNKSVVAQGYPCPDGYCPVYDLNEEPASYASGYGVWFEVLMRVYDGDVFVWVKPASDALPWEVWTIYNDPVLITEDLIVPSPKAFRVILNTGNWSNKGALQVKDVSIAAWHCEEDVPELDNTPCEDVVISEIQANNTQYPDDYAQLSPWIELWNSTGNTVDISGWYLSDDPANPAKYTFPQGTELTSPYTVVYLPNEGETGYKGIGIDEENGGFLSLTCPADGATKVLNYPAFTGAADGAPRRATTVLNYPAFTGAASLSLMPGPIAGIVTASDFAASTANFLLGTLWEYLTEIVYTLDAEYAPGVFQMVDPSSPTVWSDPLIDLVTVDGDTHELEYMADYATDIFQRDNTGDVINGVSIIADDVPCNVRFRINRLATVRQASYSGSADGFVTTKSERSIIFSESTRDIILVNSIKILDPQTGTITGGIGETAFSPSRTRIFLAVMNQFFTPQTLAHELIHSAGNWGHIIESNDSDFDQRIMGVGFNYSQGNFTEAFQPLVTMSDCQCKSLINNWSAQRSTSVNGLTTLYTMFDFTSARTLPTSICAEFTEDNGNPKKRQWTYQAP